MMSGPQPAKAKKKKRTHEDQPSLKRLKLTNSNGTGTKNSMPFENTLSLPIQEALYKFREASEQELIRLRKEGMDPSTAINKLVEKMRTIEGDIPPCFSRQELELVMEIAGINEEGATRALILRSELAKLRHDGFNHPEAINELSRRMKRLAGSKRRISLSMAEGVLSEAKLRRKEAFPASLNLSRVSFTQFDSTLDNLSRHSLEAPISRKRLQDALMLDDEQCVLRKRPKLVDKDISDSDDSGAELCHIDDVGEFSQDEDRDGKEEDELDDVFDVNSLADIPLYAPFSANDYPSSDEDASYKDLDAEGDTAGGGTSERGIRFHAVKEEESDSDDAWQFATPSTTRTTATTTTTTTTTTTATATSINATTTTPAPRTQAHIAPKTTKRRDASTHSNKTTSLSQRTIS